MFMVFLVRMSTAGMKQGILISLSGHALICLTYKGCTMAKCVYKGGERTAGHGKNCINIQRKVEREESENSW